MLLSVMVGLLMLGGKTSAYLWTNSAAILSDAVESVIHVLALSFAAYSLWLSSRPANGRFLYGYDRIAFFSAGFEGGMIALAALAIIVAAVQKWIAGITVQHLGLGTLIVAAAGAVNAGLGWYLVRTGRKTGSLILEANGKHVLTDSWTSAGVVGGLLLVIWTGWKFFDPLLAMAVALNILWSGGALVWHSVGGLMDYSDPRIGQHLKETLDSLCGELGVEYHGLKYRSTGSRLLVELHVLSPYVLPVGEAHRLATQLETRLPRMLGSPVEVVTHLEAIEDHQRVHASQAAEGSESQ